MSRWTVIGVKERIKTFFKEAKEKFIEFKEKVKEFFKPEEEIEEEEEEEEEEEIEETGGAPIPPGEFKYLKLRIWLINKMADFEEPLETEIPLHIQNWWSFADSDKNDIIYWLKRYTNIKRYKVND